MGCVSPTTDLEADVILERGLLVSRESPVCALIWALWLCETMKGFILE